MNANELADELDKCWKYDGELFEKAATMLRQLQAENEALKRPNNVVGVPQDKLTDMQVTIRQLQAENEALKKDLFMYKDVTEYWKSHPAELTDEVLEVIRAVAHIGVDFGYGEFQLDGTHVEKARAIIKASRGEDTCTPPADILRKASEK